MDNKYAYYTKLKQDEEKRIRLFIDTTYAEKEELLCLALKYGDMKTYWKVMKRSCDALYDGRRWQNNTKGYGRT